MMLKLLIGACLVAMALAQYDKCGDMQRLKVKAQWTQAFGFSGARSDLNTDLWRAIIAKYPETIDRYFERVRGDNIYSPEFKTHMARVMAGFDMTLSMIDQDADFNAQIAHLKNQHVALDVDGIYFDAFRSELMNVVQQRVDCFDQDAWEVCSKLIENGIKHN